MEADMIFFLFFSAIFIYFNRLHLLKNGDSMKKPIKLAISILIPLLAGFTGSFFTTPSIATWYASIQKPSFNPPNWIFGPVWTTLFILMGIALYLIWTNGSRKGASIKARKAAYQIFAVQIILNILWSFLFFYFHCPTCAFIEIILLWLAILANIIFFWKISRTAAYLLIPYLLWVSFASVLNFMIMVLN